MSKHIDLSKAANMIADMLARGIQITIDRNGVKASKVSIHNPANGHTATACVKDAVAKKKDARWWSRFNFEKNIMKMALFALQDRFPAEESFRQDLFATKLASMMDWKLNTARKHITQAAKMGIINRAVIGTVYHITGVNTDDASTMRELVAERDAKPEQMPLPGSAVAHEGRILFEQEFENAVDETLLP